MGSHDDEQRAAATCKRCGEIGIVQVLSDDSLLPLGQSTFCDCDQPMLEVFETDPDADDRS
nr:hypothetical protein [Natrinema caseinilyticum]